MGKNKLTRLLALVLAVACTLTVVAALGYDKNGDGKTDVWDLQLAAEDEKAGALVEALGGADELRPVEEGYYEIYSALGLYNMAKHAKEGATFKLMKDIDLGGADWTPVAEFKGIFDGNNKTISNLKITRSSYGSDGYNMGLFGDTRNADNDTNRTQIKDLNLVDVAIVIEKEDTQTRYVGGIVGTNRGDVSNCTVVCAVTDKHDMLENTLYIGAQVGRNANRTVNKETKPNGVITGTNSLDALEYYDYEPIVDGKAASNSYKGATKVNSQMAMFFTELAEGSKKRSVGISGFNNGAVSSDLLLQDTTNSTKYDGQILAERRKKVADAMYEMSTVEWSPSRTMRYIRRTVTDAGTSKTWSAGSVVRGFPYNHGSSGMDRFLSNMETNAAGRLTTLSTLPNVAVYYINRGEIKDESGNILQTAVNNTAAVNEAYKEYIAEGTSDARKATLLLTYPELPYMSAEVGSAHQVGFNMYIGADCSSQATWAWRTVSASDGKGFAAPTSTTDMYICDNYIKSRGLVAVNGFKLELPGNQDGDLSSNSSGDKSIYVKNYTRANKDFYMETLACVTKGDLLMDYTDKGGHTLVAMSDAVVIRDVSGKVLTSKSYIITAEQGGSGGTRSGTTADGKTWTSQCCVDKQTTFDGFFKEDTTETYPGIFFPITCAALREENTPAATATCKLTDGKVTSNFHIVSTTVGGETVFTNIQQSGHRSACTELVLANAHEAITAGDAVQVKLSNGQIYEFTY